MQSGRPRRRARPPLSSRERGRSLGLVSAIAASSWRAVRPRGIWGFVLRRVLLGLLTLFLVSVIVFAATQALPGDPARAFLGRTATPESLKTLREQLNPNQPAASQYWHWLKGIVTGDLGHSLTGTSQPVTTLIGKRVENSAFLMLLAG